MSCLDISLFPLMPHSQAAQQELARQQVAMALAGAMAPPAAGAMPTGLPGLGGASGVQAHVLAAQRAMNEEQEKRAKCRIYVGSLHYELKDSDIQAIFGAFGPIRSCDMSKDPATGRHKGFCFIEYMEPGRYLTRVICNTCSSPLRSKCNS
jgi:poly(U)-binding-splicing factor PUF60